MKTLAATVRDSGEGEQRWFCGGGMHTWLATSDETGGGFLLFEFAVEQGKVTPSTSIPRRTRPSTSSTATILLRPRGRTSTSCRRAEWS